MRNFVEWLRAYRADAPVDDADRQHLMARVGTLLVALGGFISLMIIPIANASHVRFHPVGILVPALVAIASVPVFYVLDGRASKISPRMFWNIVFGIFFVLTTLVSVGVYSAGGFLPLGALLYVWVGIVGTLFFSRPRAIAMIVLIGVEYAALLAFGNHFVGAAAQWVFLVATIIVTTVVLDWLVRRLRASGEREHTALQEAEAAREQLAEWNRTLEGQVAEQLDQLQVMSELRRFLSPQVADALSSSVASGGSGLLEPHRRKISVLVCDLRGFTRFAANVEPEEVMNVLDQYYGVLGDLVTQFEATVGFFAGDGMMVYFNDPVPCADPALRAVEMAVESRARISDLQTVWNENQYGLGFGLGVALGYATLGTIGFEGRRDYGPIGTVVNLASRLCDHALAGEILLDSRCHAEVESIVQATPRGAVEIKGFHELVRIFAIENIAPGNTSSEARAEILDHLDS